MATTEGLDTSTFTNFDGAAGHEGVLSDQSGEMIIKPCTDAEVAFYQETLANHPEFSELMPTFMGVLQLGAAAQVQDATVASDFLDAAHSQKEQRLHGKALATETAIVLENLEHGFSKPNVLDIKLGARLYADGTAPEKAARLDKVASETTSGSLNFRIAGMKVWNGKQYDEYDKFYGRNFNADNVKEGFATFFSGLSTGLKIIEAIELLETIEAEISKVRHVLEKRESRMYSASVLIVYEGDSTALDTLMGNVPKTPRLQEKMPTLGEVKRSEEEEEEEEVPPVVFKVKMIDFAHAAWTPGQGKDENLITGLRNVEKQMDGLIQQMEQS